MDNAQAACRVHRIGQKDGVVARMLSASGTIDDLINGLLVRKAREFTQLFDTEGEKDRERQQARQATPDHHQGHRRRGQGVLTSVSTATATTLIDVCEYKTILHPGMGRLSPRNKIIIDLAKSRIGMAPETTTTGETK